MNSFTIYPIVDGQYHVRMYLDEWMQEEEISLFQECYKKICQEDNYFKDVCFLDGHILEYHSESLFPTSGKIDSKKKKVMIILGNPATHSVANGMFFYSKVNGDGHPFWGKLENAGLLRDLGKNINDREKESKMRKETILQGDTSDEFILGLTTFYSFPTPVKPRDKDKEKQKEQRKQYPAKMKYSDAAGVEKLFKTALPKLQKMEYDRLNSYEFAQGAVWIFTQMSSYRYVKSFSKIEYWPMTSMRSGSGGEDLKKILLMP